MPPLPRLLRTTCSGRVCIEGSARVAHAHTHTHRARWVLYFAFTTVVLNVHIGSVVAKRPFTSLLSLSIPIQWKFYAMRLNWSLNACNSPWMFQACAQRTIRKEKNETLPAENLILDSAYMSTAVTQRTQFMQMHSRPTILTIKFDPINCIILNLKFFIS